MLRSLILHLLTTLIVSQMFISRVKAIDSFFSNVICTENSSLDRIKILSNNIFKKEKQHLWNY